MLKKSASVQKAEVEAERGSDRPHLSLNLDLSLLPALHFGRGINGH
jgi:hypothetical protein